jgi:shikimate dehydrogenase
MPVSPDAFPRLTGVLDAVYNPLSTRLVLEARRLGIRAEGGLYMLTAQAVLAAEIFTGRTLGKEATERIFAEVLTEKENIVLIGMPGSGKTTVGKLLAARLSRPHVDTDGEIAAAAGTTIPEIFARQGEEAFRDRESEVIRRLAVRGGCVISTGGGAILRPENVAALRQNGKLFWLDRPQEQLVPTADRPLADSEEKLRRLAAVREPLYRAAADVTVDAGVSPEEAADTIIKELP